MCKFKKIIISVFISMFMVFYSLGAFAGASIQVKNLTDGSIYVASIEPASGWAITPPTSPPYEITAGGTSDPSWEGPSDKTIHVYLMSASKDPLVEVTQTHHCEDPACWGSYYDMSYIINGAQNGQNICVAMHDSLFTITQC